MQRLRARAVALGMCAMLAGGAWGGCSPTKATELVPGVSTQIQVPRNLHSVRVDVQANGRTVFCSFYDVTNGQVALPATLGLVSATSPETQVIVDIRGYDAPGAMGTDISNCEQGAPVGAPMNYPTGGPGPRVLRRSIQTYVGGRILFLPMPISYSCFDVDCSLKGAASACKGNQCLDSNIDATKLVDFDESLLDGKGICFDPAICFSDAVPAKVLDAANCTYGFPEAMPPGPGMNVRVFYEDLALTQNTVTGIWEPVLQGAGEEEILNENGDEGFTVVGPQQFQLAPGLCSLAQAAKTPPSPPAMGTTVPYRIISDIQVASACGPKSILLPICANAQQGNLPDASATTDGGCNVAQPLIPTPSALYLAMDDSLGMNGFYKGGDATVLGIRLGDPVFKRTFVASRFLTHLDSECTSATTAYSMPAIEFGISVAVQPQIAAQFGNWNVPAGSAPPANAHLDLQAAMRDVGAYKHVSDFTTPKNAPFNVKGVMYFVNRVTDSTPTDVTPPNLFDDCNPPVGAAANATIAIETEATNAFKNSGVQTFFVVIDDNAGDGPTVTLPFYNGVTQAIVAQATSPIAAQTIDATGGSGAVALNFGKVATQLGTCVYETPNMVTTAASLAFTDPFSGMQTTVAPDATCNVNTAMTANGWNIDANGRIYICGPPCTNLRNLILQDTAIALSQMPPLPVPDVPVTVTMPCQ